MYILGKNIHNKNKNLGDLMLIQFIRITIIFLMVLLAMRGMGKRQIGELQPFELVIAIIIADVASAPLGDVEVPLMNGIIPVGVIFFFQMIFSYFSQKSKKFRQILSGKPEYIIRDGKIDQQSVETMLMTIDDIKEQMRLNSVNDISEIENMIMEDNGNISVTKKTDTRIAISLVETGHLMKENFPITTVTEKDLKKEMKKQKINSYKEIFWAYVNGTNITIIKRSRS